MIQETAAFDFKQARSQAEAKDVDRRTVQFGQNFSPFALELGRHCTSDSIYCIGHPLEHYDIGTVGVVKAIWNDDLGFYHPVGENVVIEPEGDRLVVVKPDRQPILLANAINLPPFHRFQVDIKLVTSSLRSPIICIVTWKNLTFSGPGEYCKYDQWMLNFNEWSGQEFPTPAYSRPYLNLVQHIGFNSNSDYKDHLKQFLPFFQDLQIRFEEALTT